MSPGLHWQRIAAPGTPSVGLPAPLCLGGLIAATGQVALALVEAEAVEYRASIPASEACRRKLRGGTLILGGGQPVRHAARNLVRARLEWQHVAVAGLLPKHWRTKPS